MTNPLLRAAALGAAGGLRSTAGAVALALVTGRGRALAGALAVGELVADKLPAVPPRTRPAGLLPRLLTGAAAAAAAARRDGAAAAPAAVLGLAAAGAAAALGVRLRAAAQHRLGSDLPGALAEDAVAALLVGTGARR